MPYLDHVLFTPCFTPCFTPYLAHVLFTRTFTPPCFSPNLTSYSRLLSHHTSRLLYTLGRHGKLNFPLSEEEQTELDALGVGEVMQAFKLDPRKRRRHRWMGELSVCGGGDAGLTPKTPKRWNDPASQRSRSS